MPVEIRSRVGVRSLGSESTDNRESIVKIGEIILGGPDVEVVHRVAGTLFVGGVGRIRRPPARAAVCRRFPHPVGGDHIPVHLEAR